jgi:ABC-2 type transport system ATP-binding protein
MKQRLGLADVLIKKPKVVFLDEPTSGLDPKGINQLLKIIEDMPAMGTTVVLSSHQLYQVQKVCHSVGILSKGKMVVEGSLDELGRNALAEGRFVIDVEIAEPSPRLAEAIRVTEGVTAVEEEGNRLKVSTDSDLRAKIAEIVVQSGIPLVQMKVEQFSLDDIYMKYFREG